MKITTVILIWMYFVSSLRAQFVDTIAISTRIDNIKTKEDAKEFLSEVWEIDQRHRGTRTNDSIDLVNLFKVSFYLNRFGFPTAKEFGELSVMPEHVYVHVANRHLKRLAFNIVWEGYKHGEITEKDLRTRHISGISNCLEEVTYLERTPFKILFEDLEIEPSNNIAIERMLAKLEDSHLHHSFSVKSQWQSKDIVKEYLVNNETIEMTFPGEILEIQSDENLKLYHRTTTTNTAEPRELKQVNENEYIFVDCEKEKLVIHGDFIQHLSGTRILNEYKTTENTR